MSFAIDSNLPAIDVWSKAGRVTSEGQASPTRFAALLQDESTAERAHADRDEVYRAASELVSTTFIAPILAQLRDSPFGKSGPFAPGAAERRFAPLLDQHLADSVTSAANFDLVDTIVQRVAPGYWSERTPE